MYFALNLRMPGKGHLAVMGLGQVNKDDKLWMRKLMYFTLNLRLGEGTSGGHGRASSCQERQITAAQTNARHIKSKNVGVGTPGGHALASDCQGRQTVSQNGRAGSLAN